MLFILVRCLALAADIKGKVTDYKTGEPLIGASVITEGKQGAVTDQDGLFTITGLNSGSHTLTIRYVAYETLVLEGIKAGSQEMVDIKLKPDEQEIGEVRVTGMLRRNTEAALIEEARTSQLIVSNISAQEIKRTQDSNASEVIRRVPGVSLIDEKFVMVRGLSQRYNNVWINGGAVPSSEADSRAFSFDIIPSSQIDNLIIVKSPSPEYPADFSGGFILINTKDIPSENSFSVSLGAGWNDRSAFSDFSYSKGSGTDFLAFDNGLRSLKGGINATLNEIDGDGTVDLEGNGFNNDWRVRTKKPWGDLKIGAELARRWNLEGGGKAGLLFVANYSNEYRTYEDMINNQFGSYDMTHDRSNYLRQSTDNQYNNNVRLGALLNMAWLSAGGHTKLEWKNIFNQLATERYTCRTGISAQSDNEQSAEYFYRSRTTISSQLTGTHTLNLDEIDWSASYSYSNRRIPDRRQYLINDAQTDDGTLQLSNGNDITREYTKLDEHIMSASLSDEHLFSFGSFEPSLKVGAYGEYRTREYTTRNFIYNWNTSSNSLPDGFRQMDITELLSNSDYFGADGLYMLEDPQMRNNYSGHNTLAAGYLAATLPFGRFSIYAGVRFEFNEMELISNTKDYEKSPKSLFYTDNDLFPSINTTFRINDKQQLRLSYGKSVNRPEFREVSSSVFYDFDLASNVQGNTNLEPCYIHNVDLRYEIYPSRGEVISIAAFYKHFDKPIEWTYTVSGGTDLVYSYENAKSADNYGIEIDIRKTLEFIGLKDFSLSLNAALIHSRVRFDDDSRNEDRAMQGQSPYLINGGLFYINEKLGINASLLYNRIGKRIIGVGRSEGTTGSDDNARIPDSYEMPRNVIDLNISKQLGKHWELRASIRDLLAEKICYKQFADITYDDGTTKEVEQITRQYKPGRNISVSAAYKF